MPSTMTRRRILVIDDEPSFTRLLRLNLEMTGRYEVREENRGAAALATAEEFQPDVILLDLIMPDRDGASVAEQLKQGEKLKHIPILFVTALVSKQETTQQEGVIGGNLFIAKPVTPDELVRWIERCLEQRGESARSGQPAGVVSGPIFSSRSTPQGERGETR